VPARRERRNEIKRKVKEIGKYGITEEKKGGENKTIPWKQYCFPPPR
jgi:hypothetical protein